MAEYTISETLLTEATEIITRNDFYNHIYISQGLKNEDGEMEVTEENLVPFLEDFVTYGLLSTQDDYRLMDILNEIKEGDDGTEEDDEEETDVATGLNFVSEGPVQIEVGEEFSMTYEFTPVNANLSVTATNSANSIMTIVHTAQTKEIKVTGVAVGISTVTITAVDNITTHTDTISFNVIAAEENPG